MMGVYAARKHLKKMYKKEGISRQIHVTSMPREQDKEGKDRSGSDPES